MTLTTLRLSKGAHRVGIRDHGHGVPLVLIHGVGMQSAAWMPQIEALKDHYRVIAVDLPGHGRSTPLPLGSTLSDYVGWVSDVVSCLALPRVSVAGHSMGALIAAGFAVTHPDVVARVALLNGVFRRSDAARAAVVARAADIRKGGVDFDTPLNRWFGQEAAEQQIRRQVAGWLHQMDVSGYATAYQAFAQGDTVYADRFSGIECPFLAMTGDGDPNSTPQMAQAMADAVRDGQAVTIAGHRHMVNLTAPDQVTAQLQAWMKRTETQKELQ